MIEHSKEIRYWVVRLRSAWGSAYHESVSTVEVGLTAYAERIEQEFRDYLDIAGLNAGFALFEIDSFLMEDEDWQVLAPYLLEEMTKEEWLAGLSEYIKERKARVLLDHAGPKLN